jgi:hypothetical protein
LGAANLDNVFPEQEYEATNFASDTDGVPGERFLTQIKFDKTDESSTGDERRL